MIEQLRRQLEQINLAIAKIEKGAQEYRLNGRSLRRGDLATLYKERRQLQTELANYENSGGMYAAVFYR
ncbi:MAG: hypothetical protein ACRDBM_16515 [Sporomusa sp.]